jgi:hypothetical protein
MRINGLSLFSGLITYGIVTMAVASFYIRFIAMGSFCPGEQSLELIDVRLYAFLSIIAALPFIALGINRKYPQFIRYQALLMVVLCSTGAGIYSYFGDFVPFAGVLVALLNLWVISSVSLKDV